jgi:hypothetical protein
MYTTVYHATFAAFKARILLSYRQRCDAATGIDSASEQPALRDLTVALFLPTAAERRPFPLSRPVNV